MPEWLIAIIAAGVVTLIASLLKRAKIKKLGYKIGTAGRKVLLAFDIPVIEGKSEKKIKDTILATFTDFIIGVAEGLVGKEFDNS